MALSVWIDDIAAVATSYPGPIHAIPDGLLAA